jgi:hypothetical protein
VPLAKVPERKWQPSTDFFADLARDTDPSWLGQTFESGSNVHGITVDIVVLDNEVAKVDADSEPNTLDLADIPLPFRHTLLYRHGTANGVDHTCEFAEPTITCQLYEAASVFGEKWLD